MQLYRTCFYSAALAALESRDVARDYRYTSRVILSMILAQGKTDPKTFPSIEESRSCTSLSPENPDPFVRAALYL